MSKGAPKAKGNRIYLKVLNHLAEADASRVGADGDADLGGHEVDGEDVVEAAHPGRVDLAELHGAALQELLEHDAVLAHLPGGHADTWG